MVYGVGFRAAVSKLQVVYGLPRSVATKLQASVGLEVWDLGRGFWGLRFSGERQFLEACSRNEVGAIPGPAHFLSVNS